MKQLTVVMFLLLSIQVTAQYNKKPRVVSRSSEVFNNTDCAKTNTCDLLQVRYLAEDYEIWVADGMHYGTRFFAHYITDSIDTLENYAFVQFIKGCQYWSSSDTGEIVLTATYNFLKHAPFNYMDWVIESADTDPIYFSTPNSRHFNYKWNTQPNSVDRSTEKYFGLDKPTRPELYISDIPYTAFYMNGSAKNISLAFKTCLYKTSDVPAESSPENINFATPITCYYWYSSWVYNHTTNTFENPREISPECNK